MINYSCPQRLLILSSRLTTEEPVATPTVLLRPTGRRGAGFWLLKTDSATELVEIVTGVWNLDGKF
jgi:hypothetical protein